MKTGVLLDRVVRRLACLALAAVFSALIAGVASASVEQTFDLLQIGSTTYRNVTVTTKSKDYVFILHSRGMTNLKVGELPNEIRAKLGYGDAGGGSVRTNASAVWARQTLSKIEVPQMKQLEQQLAGWSGVRLSAQQFSSTDLLIVAGVFLALYLFHSYCCLLICAKAGSEPSPLIWIPLLQLIPLLKAASMPLWWFVMFLVPGLNVIAQIVLCVKLTQARRKAFGVALLLIFPLTSPFAAMYLAFSGGRSRRKDDRRIEIMTLETA